MENVFRPRPWTMDEQRFLMENFATMPYVDLVEKLGRKRTSIRNKARQLGLKREEDNRQVMRGVVVLTESDAIELREYYATHSNIETAAHFRVPVSLLGRVSEMAGLRKDKTYKQKRVAAISGREWTEEELAVLRDMYPK